MHEELVTDDRLRSSIAVAIDGEVRPLGLLQPVAPTSEVHFVLAISGGSRDVYALVGFDEPTAAGLMNIPTIEK